MNLPSVVFHFAHALGAGDAHAELAAMLACAATLAGHVCADLDQEAGWGPFAEKMDAAARADFLARLSALPIVGGAGDWTPLVLDGRRLYLRRYWDYEQKLAQYLAACAAGCESIDAALEARLMTLFTDAGQRAAARCALTHRLCLISGGPGTGKTYTLARIIALLREQRGDARIALAAPTGKAAARMGEALGAAGVKGVAQAQTLHRLLGMRADGTSFLHGPENPLVLDALIVDEASMVDLALMAHLIDALPARARLILLGDRDQLAAVEAGAVFADLCASEPLAHCVASLTTNFRFGSESGIGRLAEALRDGDADAALELLRTGGAEISWQPAADQRTLVAAARTGYAPYLKAVAEGLPVEQLYAQFARFRVLCAHREEVAALNRALGDTPIPGLPLMILKNEPQLRLFNGDIGLTLPDPTDGLLKACFPASAGSAARWIPLARLPAWEPAWAMTVHKAQGSEFERVLLILPAQVSPVVTRELIYTGVTRARAHVELRGAEKVLRAAIRRRAERMSGLRERLSGCGSVAGSC